MCTPGRRCEVRTIVSSETMSGGYKVTIWKEGFGRYADYFFTVTQGYHTTKGGAYRSEKEAREEAYEAINRIQSGRVMA